MKTLFSTALLIVSVVFAAGAQERSIDFEKSHEWAEIVKIAREADRLIFVDCYTDWCGPCQRVAAEVFTQNEVADFFNENFVNVKIEMEKDVDGASLAEKYDVTAFPTFLFINPHTGKLEYVKVGCDDDYQWLIDAARAALGEGPRDAELADGGQTITKDIDRAEAAN